MRIILKAPGDQQWKLDLPGTTRDDCDLLARWLAHILTPDQVQRPGPAPLTLTLEIW